MVFLVAQTESLQALEPFLFYPFAIMAAVGALWVVFSQQIVRMAVALLIALCGVAALYFLLEAEFIAAIQLIVYVGGTLILIIFGVMLTSKGPDDHFPVALNQRLLGWIIGLCSAVLMAVIGVVGVIGPQRASGPTNADGTAALGIMGPTETHGSTASLEVLGEALISSYVIPLEIAAVLLLVVMIGAAYIAKGRHHEVQSERAEEEMNGGGQRTDA